MATKLSVVVPCYDEEDVLPETNKRLLALMDSMQGSGLISGESSIHFVDDGSKDRTWQMIESFAAADPRVHGIKLSRNRGHQNALLAGLFAVEADAVITVDADLQDDITVMEEMVKAFQAGSEIVYGVRDSRATDTVFKRGTASLYYKLLHAFGVDIVYNHADYRLMGKVAIDALKQYDEVNLFLRGVIPLLGFPSSTVYYDRSERFAGESKYPLRKMVSLAINGITSFSVVPLRFITLLGMVVSIISFAMTLWVLYGWYFTGTTIPGWASSVVPMYFLGGIQLLSIGVVGEYVSKIYLETKRRPRYFIEKKI
ncbi:MAG: glycosyltransferase family 2 protein [Candidatus Methylumidiphilus sp.]